MHTRRRREIISKQVPATRSDSTLPYNHSFLST